MQKVQKMQSKNDTVPQKYLANFVTIPHFYKITTCNYTKKSQPTMSDPLSPNNHLGLRLHDGLSLYLIDF